ncbi:hypothetical protein [uncultured Paludibaculum sp.]|uniref:hypothetical protein n=1 Tax=uncultured Paludibaculum sp. TaxID=1765020 RepID=UPI002AAA80D3|nr:hypothetical protein [uncultured Paludibaculum sp.]
MKKQSTRAKTTAPAKPSVRAKVAKKGARCVVCAAEVAPFSTEELCWVCRRLKISAWRDVEGQAAIQE